MGFLKKLFGGGEQKPTEYVDKTGIYFYVQCDNCGQRVKVRADKQHDLLNDGGGYVWHKTIVDSKCFRRMETVVYLDRGYNVVNSELTGGKFMSAAAYEAAEQAAAEQAAAETAAAEAPDSDEKTEEDNTE